MVDALNASKRSEKASVVRYLRLVEGQVDLAVSQVSLARRLVEHQI